VPALSLTTCPLGQDAIASLIAAAVAPGSRVAQVMVRFGMPQGVPTLVQSMAREGSMMPDHGWVCAWEYVGRQSKMRENRSNFFRLISYFLDVTQEIAHPGKPRNSARNIHVALLRPRQIT